MRNTHSFLETLETPNPHSHDTTAFTLPCLLKNSLLACVLPGVFPTQGPCQVSGAGDRGCSEDPGFVRGEEEGWWETRYGQEESVLRRGGYAGTLLLLYVTFVQTFKNEYSC